MKLFRRALLLPLVVLLGALVAACVTSGPQKALNDVADALSARHWLERQLATQQQGLQVQRERTRLVRMRYDSGAISYLEVLDAERSLLQAEQDWVVTRRQLLATHITLFAALGGGALGSTPAPLP